MSSSSTVSSTTTTTTPAYSTTTPSTTSTTTGALDDGTVHRPGVAMGQTLSNMATSINHSPLPMATHECAGWVEVLCSC